jgi:aquaporin Z
MSLGYGDVGETNSLLMEGSINDRPVPVRRAMKLAAPLVMELFGTFMLTLAVVLSRGNPLAPGTALVALVFMAGHVSGGQFNPAVTLGIFLSRREKISLTETLEYMLVQLVGGVGGGLFGYLLLDGEGAVCPQLGEGVKWYQGALAELAFTTMLVFVILNVATTQDGNSFFGEPCFNSSLPLYIPFN